MTGRPEEEVRRARLGAGAIPFVAAVVLAVVVLANLVSEAHRVIGWAVAAAVVAVLLEPLVALVSRWLPKVLALVLVGLAIAAAAGGLVYGVLGDMDTETARLAAEGQEAAAELEARDDRWGEVARDVRLAERADAFFGEVRDRFGEPEESLRSAAGSLPTYFVSWILTIFLMLHGGRIVAGALGLIDDTGRRRRWAEVVATAADAARRSILAAVLQGVVVGLVTAAVVQALDLPAPVLTGLLAGAVGVLPYIGITIASLPVALLAGGLVDPAAGVAVLLGAIALQTVEVLVVRRRLDARSLHVGPAVPVVVAVLGYEVYGVGGAAYGAALAVFGLALLDAAARPDDPDVTTPIEDPDDLGERPAPPVPA